MQISTELEMLATQNEKHLFPNYTNVFSLAEVFCHYVSASQFNMQTGKSMCCVLQCFDIAVEYRGTD